MVESSVHSSNVAFSGGAPFQILRQDFFARQKDWQDELAMTAPDAVPSFDEEMDSSPSFEGMLPFLRSEVCRQWRTDGGIVEIEMAEQDSSRRHEELEQLVSSMPDELEERIEEQVAYSTVGYGSDDENFDQLFLDFLSQQDAKTPPDPTSSREARPEDQDVEMSTV